VTSYRLYGSLYSGHSYKVRLALLLLGIAHDYHSVDIRLPTAERDPDWQRLSRFGEVPVLVVDERPIVQSNAILLHLAREHRTLGWEVDPDTLAQWLFWEANRIGLALPNYRFHSLFAERLKPEVMAWLEVRMLADLAALEEAVSTTPFLMGDRVSAADIAAAAYLLYEDVPEADLGRCPKVRGWLDRLRGLPGWRAPLDVMG
jgi:glutathione S-transferase